MLVVTTEKTDIYRNLALEEWLLDHAPQLPVLFLYVNDSCVVIGKNQNPWRECRLSLMGKEGVPLARRISGGGAVYHDKGNLNVSVIVPRTEYREEKQYELILETLSGLGIAAERLGKNSLAVNGKKFSGHAFCHRRDRTLHHGTLLVNSDLDRLGRYLGPEVEGIETKAVASVPSEVINLVESAPGLTVETLSAALTDTFKKEYGSGGVWECWSDPGETGFHGTGGMVPEAELLPNIGKLSSNDWKLRHTPKFTFRGVEVEKGCVTNLEGNPQFEEWLKNER